MNSIKPVKEDTFFSPVSDWGFKRIFGSETNKILQRQLPRQSLCTLRYGCHGRAALCPEEPQEHGLHPGMGFSLIAIILVLPVFVNKKPRR